MTREEMIKNYSDKLTGKEANPLEKLKYLFVLEELNNADSDLSKNVGNIGFDPDNLTKEELVSILDKRDVKEIIRYTIESVYSPDEILSELNEEDIEEYAVRYDLVNFNSYLDNMDNYELVEHLRDRFDVEDIIDINWRY